MDSEYDRHVPPSRKPARTAWMAACAVVLAIATPVGWRFATSSMASSSIASSRSEKTVVASIRAEPRSFNRYAARDLTTEVITRLMQSALVRVDRVSGRLEPELAERWVLLPDQVTYRLHLRRGVRFSDGAPFSADDVVFSFRAIYDERAGNLIADTLRVRGRPLAIAAEDPTTITIRFPTSFGPGLRLLDGVPIFPRHRLERMLQEGSFAKAWGPSTPPSEIVGLGPFLLRRYDPGQRLVFDRNPLHWRSEQGRLLPVVDHVVLEVTTDQDAELLRLESGEIDFTQSEVRPADIASLRRAAGRVALTDLGVGLDGDLLWFNLAPAKAADPRSRWLQHAAFRRAVVHAVDRDAFVNMVYLGAAVAASGVVSPGNTRWFADVPMPVHDVAEASRLLTSLDLRDRDGDGVLDDSKRMPVRFTLLTQAGNSSLERGASTVRDHLARVGIRVDVVPLEVGALVHHLMAGDYDAMYFRLLMSDTDPALNGDFWLSSGDAHIWNPSQKKPATSWEAEIDRLMEHIATSLDARQRWEAFRDVQRIMAREVPVVCFAYPRWWIAMNRRITHATPAAVRPPILWNPAIISVADELRETPPIKRTTRSR